MLLCNFSREKGQTVTTSMRHVLLVSGGKDSTALALYMREKHPEIQMEYVFCDTQKELRGDLRIPRPH